jgi:hypothetical protein
VTTLLEALQPKLSGASTSLPNSQLGQTQSLRNVVQTGTGKIAGPDSGPQENDVGELQAANETKLQGQIQAGQQQVENAGVQQKQADVQSAGEQAEQTLNVRSKDAQSAFEARANTILSDYTNGQRKVQTQRDVMAMEQAGAAIRLQNQQYVTQLEQAGQMARLQNDTNFREQAYRDAFAGDEIMMKDDIMFKEMMDADARTFQYSMGQMDLDYALKVADMATKQANSQAVAQGVGGVIGAGAGALGQKAGSWFKDTSTEGFGGSGTNGSLTQDEEQTVMNERG